MPLVLFYLSLFSWVRLRPLYDEIGINRWYTEVVKNGNYSGWPLLWGGIAGFGVFCGRGAPAKYTKTRKKGDEMNGYYSS
mgnify:CR=1 FL=1